MEQRNIIYRVAVSGLHCRSSIELVNLRVAALEGVEAASISPDHVLTVFADADTVSPSDIVRTLIDVGVAPEGEISGSPVADVVEASAATKQEAAIAEFETAEEPAQVSVESSVEADLLPAANITDSLPEPVFQPVALLEAVEPHRSTVAANCVAHILSDHSDVVGATELAPTGSSEDLAGSHWPDEVAHAAVEESIKADIETPHVAVSPRAALVQRIKVVVSDDYYPNRIEVIPGVPVDIEFSEGHGCLARVVFEEFDIDQDLTNGGATVRLPGLTTGTHEFTCGMRMVYGTVVAGI